MRRVVVEFHSVRIIKTFKIIVRQNLTASFALALFGNIATSERVCSTLQINAFTTP